MSFKTFFSCYRAARGEVNETGLERTITPQGGDAATFGEYFRPEHADRTAFSALT